MQWMISGEVGSFTWLCVLTAVTCRSKQGRQATSMQQAAKVTQEAVDDLKTRALPQLQRSRD
jgi:hypothetical protein